MGWLCGLSVLLGAWVILLRRHVRDLNHVVREQQHRNVAQDERYADLVGRVSDVVFGIDVAGRLTAVNAAAVATTGYTRAELLSGSILDVVIDEHRDETRRWLQQASAHHAHHDVSFATVILTKDGRRISLEGRLRALTLDGAPIGFEGVARGVATGVTDGEDASPPAPAPRRLVV